METTEPKPEKKVKFCDNLELIEEIRKQYFSGDTLTVIAKRYRLPLPVLYFQVKKGSWKDMMEQQGLPVPREPKPDFTPLPKETWDKIESDFMKGETYKSLSYKYDVSKTSIAIRSRRFKWEYYRSQIEDAKRRRTSSQALANRLSEFDEVSCKFIEAAIGQIRRMAEDIESNKHNLNPEWLERVIKMHSGLHDSVKKIPTSKQAPQNNEDTHPALRPAKILKVG